MSIDKLKKVKVGDPISAEQQNIIRDLLKKQSFGNNSFIDPTGSVSRDRSRRRVIQNFTYQKGSKLYQLFLAKVISTTDDVLKCDIYQIDSLAGTPRVPNANYWITPTGEEVTVGYINNGTIAGSFEDGTLVPTLKEDDIIFVVGEHEDEIVSTRVGIGNGARTKWTGSLGEWDINPNYPATSNEPFAIDGDPIRPHPYSFRAFVVDDNRQGSLYSKYNPVYQSIIVHSKTEPANANDAANSWRSDLERAGNTVYDPAKASTNWVDWRGDFAFSIDFEEAPQWGTSIVIEFDQEVDWKYTWIQTPCTCTHVTPVIMEPDEVTTRGTVAAQTDIWDITSQGANDGVQITMLVRETFDTSDGSWYYYYREFTYDSCGRLVYIGAEYRAQES